MFVDPFQGKRILFLRHYELFENHIDFKIVLVSLMCLRMIKIDYITGLKFKYLVISKSLCIRLSILKGMKFILKWKKCHQNAVNEGTYCCFCWSHNKKNLSNMQQLCSPLNLQIPLYRSCRNCIWIVFHFFEEMPQSTKAIKIT